MFLAQTIKKNRVLMEEAFPLHRAGIIQPDTYLVDVDTLVANAALMLKEADAFDIKLYFMLKQLGRNPYIAERLLAIGYPGAVCVDYREVQLMMDAKIPIGNAGHLVQIPEAMIKPLVAYGPDFITVYSFEKIQRIQNACKELGTVQNVLLRVYQTGDDLYSGQEAGFDLSELPNLIMKVKNECPLVQIKGVTSFPCFLYNENMNDIRATNNVFTVREAARILTAEGIEPEIINMPSAACVRNMKQMKSYGGNCAEPGHGLTGTTPMHAFEDLAEQPAVVYVSEISHNFLGKAYCYGGGYYRRSHVQWALVGRSFADAGVLPVTPPADDAIDYHLELSQACRVGDTALMAFRFQMFVCRSDIALIEGLHERRGKIVGIYDCTGRKKL